jgi:hypothetical protein
MRLVDSQFVHIIDVGYWSRVDVIGQQIELLSWIQNVFSRTKMEPSFLGEFDGAMFDIDPLLLDVSERDLQDESHSANEPQGFEYQATPLDT